MRWMPALLLCGCLATLSAVLIPAQQSLATQDAAPTPPSAIAAEFCPADQLIPVDDDSVLEPKAEAVGAVPVTNIENPYEGGPSSGKLVLTFVTLPPHSCILGSHFYPSMNMTVTSGQIDILIEHWPGVAAAPEAFLRRSDTATSEDVALGAATLVGAGDWVKIENESFVGFRNTSDAEAKFTVAGLKPDGPPGGGGCGGGCRGQP